MRGEGRGCQRGFYVSGIGLWAAQVVGGVEDGRLSVKLAAR